MLSKQMTGFTAPKLRIVLISMIALCIVLCIVGFWFFRSQLVTYAQQVQSDNAVALSSSDDILNLQNLQKQLKDDNVAVTRAKSIVADSQFYQYQNQIISDLSAYAKSSGVTITGFTFSEAAAATAAAPVAPVPTTPLGLKTTTASITIKNPVTYTAIMKFIHSIELNLTKMQLSGISMTGVATNPAEVTINPISVEVYTR